MLRVIGVGDNVCDKYLHTGTIYPGGNALNVAVFCRMLGAEAAYLGVFGDDEVGVHVASTAESLGLDLSRCHYEQGENGLARVALVDGDRVFLPGNRGGVSREKPPMLTAEDGAYLASFDLVHTSVYSFMEESLGVMMASGAFVSMDFSDRRELDYLQGCAPYLDCAEVSCGDMPEAEVLSLCETLLDAGVREMVIATRGAKGAVLHTGDRIYRQSPNLIRAKDTMGAGDSFIACFLYHYLSGRGDASDFPVCGEAQGIVTAEEYLDALIRASLYRAACFSARQCLRNGSFGHGKPVGLTDADRNALAEFQTRE